MNALLDYTIQGKAYSCFTGFAAINLTTETVLFYLLNPEESEAKIVITHAFSVVKSGAVLSTTRFYKNAVRTSSGTEVTPVNLGGSSATVAQCWRGPTITTPFPNELPAKVTPEGSANAGRDMICALDPGESLLITVENSIINVPTGGGAFWLQMPL